MIWSSYVLKADMILCVILLGPFGLFSFVVIFVNIFLKCLMSKCPNSACNMVKSSHNHSELGESAKYLIEMHE